MSNIVRGTEHSEEGVRPDAGPPPSTRARRATDRYRRVRRFALPLVDAGAWLVGLTIGVATRYDWDLTKVSASSLAAVVLIAVAVHGVIGFSSSLYRGRHSLGSAGEAGLLAAVVMSTGVVVLAVDLGLAPPPLPRSVPLPAAVITLGLAAAVRFAVRARREFRARRDTGSAQRVIVFGAGASGEALVRSMISRAEPGYHPVALLDDDPALRQRRICGVPVRGPRSAVAEVAVGHRADLLVIAIHDLARDVVAEVTRLASDVGLAVKVLPPLHERLTPGVSVADLADLDVNALLGRAPRETNTTAVSAILRGRRVLVTGAGGSIGSELCRQIVRFAPGELMMLDRDESALHAVQLSIYGKALLDSPDVVLADIRDREAVDRIFAERRPEVVFHAAALKHLPMLEQYPEEAWKTNVLGTANVLEAASRLGVETLLNISTDKAANPTSVLGRSKRIGERLVAAVADEADGTFLSVRFGNVLGSRGSVLETFYGQIAADTPVTVTHPEVTRFFMTIPEAVALVLQAAAIGRPGEVLLLDMGAPVRIVDVARQLMSFAGTSTEIVFTGLREGEKLHEELFGAGEIDDRPYHPAISQVPVPALAVRAVRSRSDSIANAMSRLCGPYQVPEPREAGSSGRELRIDRAASLAGLPVAEGERS